MKGNLVKFDRNPVISVESLYKHFPIKKGIIKRTTSYVHAVDGISFEIFQGETLGLVGESGSGKSTVGRTILQLYKPTKGKVYFKGEEISSYQGGDLRKIRRQMQMVFQDPHASLNPRMKIDKIISEPLEVHNIGAKARRKERINELITLVGLDPSFLRRYPHEFSGGQLQRIGIARALALNPDFIVCDEPISALDVSVQAQVVNLLEELQRKFNLTYLFIAHDLSMVRHISDRVAVMYLGILVELANRDELFTNPMHPYTEAILSAVPIPDPVIEAKRKRIILEGDVPSPISLPTGCRFRTRCPYAKKICSEEVPVWRQIASDHWIACHIR